MKRIFLYIVAFIIIFLAVPILFIDNNSRIIATTPEQNSKSSQATSSQSENTTPDTPDNQIEGDNQNDSETQPPNTLTLEDTITLYDIGSGEYISVSYLDYMIGAVAAEMPANFDIEALKAQALASLSYAIYYSENFPNQSLSCDIENNKGYMDRDAMSDFWGIRYMEYYLKISSGCQEVLGEAILYDNAPIAAAYHASSALATAASEQVWTSSLPYLRSVATVEDYDISAASFHKDEVVKILSADNPSAAFSLDTAALFSDIYYFENGYVDTINLAGKLYTGEQLRALFSLRSAAITITYQDDTFTFETMGYGHGVGLSQEGAQVLATNGYNYKDILKYYYTDVTIENYY